VSNDALAITIFCGLIVLTIAAMCAVWFLIASIKPQPQTQRIELFCYDENQMGGELPHLCEWKHRKA
jgi:hypothetical protein